jgi:carbon storage regulator CsrA
MLHITVDDADDINDYVMIGDDVKLTFRISGRRIKLCVDAPRHIPVRRAVVYEAYLRQKAEESVAASN